MNVEIEVSVKIKMLDGSSIPQVETCKSTPLLTRLLEKIAVHPCIAMIIQEVMQKL